MCGRYSLTVEADDIQDVFPDFVLGAEAAAQWTPRFNIAPTQDVPVVLNDGRHEVSLARWGLIPSWAEDPAIGSRMINARSETLAEKPSFRTPFKKRRCVVLADGFYEWKPIAGEKTKQPFHVHMKSRKPFALAGLWETWTPKAGEGLRSCTILTTSPNSLMAKIHDRMPVILDAEGVKRWLAKEERTATELQDLLVPFDASAMETEAVSTYVNSPAHQGPECMAPAQIP